MKLSVAIITFNEEANIERCLKSVDEVADEIIVVDSFSTDQTKEICKKFPVRFITHVFEGHIQQKNIALQMCSFENVLSLDADEALSPELIAEIKKIKRQNLPGAYCMNRMTNYCGKWIRHGAWYPDTKLRLVIQSQAVWTGINPHDELTLITPRKIKKLKGDILHFSFPTVEDHIAKSKKYSDIQSKALFEMGKRSNIFQIVFSPVFRFIRDYFFKAGFMDGSAGFRIAAMTSMTVFRKYFKLWKLSRS